MRSVPNKHREDSGHSELESVLSSDGEDHYKKGAMQPAVFIKANAMQFFEGSVVKYITRHRHSADGKKDLNKAIHYIEMILASDYGEDQ